MSILTGLFKSFIVMYLIVFIHELGHIVMALIFKYKIVKINIYPFGGYTILDGDINTSFISELMVFFGGILFQLLFFIISKNIVDNNSYIYELIKNYNTTILIFNMIPIIPLDGAKVLNIIFNKIMPFKKAHILTIYVSYILLVILIIKEYKNLNMILISMLLLYLLITEHKRHKYIYNKFLLERYIKDISYKKNNFINNLDLKYMKKYINNVFVTSNKYISEKELLGRKFTY